MLRKMWNLSSGAAVAPGGKGESCAQLNHGNTKEQLFADLHQEVGSGRCIQNVFSSTSSRNTFVGERINEFAGLSLDPRNPLFY